MESPFGHVEVLFGTGSGISPSKGQLGSEVNRGFRDVLKKERECMV